MSIATEITRIQQAKADIKTAIEAKGVTVPSSATIDTYDDYVSQISGGLSRVTSGTPYCLRRDLVVDTQTEISIDGGASWVNSGSPSVVIVESGAAQCYDFSYDYLTFVAETDNVTFTLTGTSNVFQYSLDDGITWNNLQGGSTSPSINNGDSIMWKGSNLSVNTETGIGIIRPSAAARVEGNVMSLIYGDDFASQTVIPNNYNLRKLFSGATNITSAENMVLPATTVKQQCYSQMFQGCTNLTATPKTVGSSAMTWGGTYAMSNMFSNCTSLINVSSNLLPALNLGTQCYWYMFEGCSGLTESPILSATNLASQCYNGMFMNCSSLNSVICLSTSTMSFSNWLTGVASTGTFYKMPNVGWESGLYGIPSDWTVVDYSS